eukprot:IDg6410t1
MKTLEEFDGLRSTSRLVPNSVGTGCSIWSDTGMHLQRLFRVMTHHLIGLTLSCHAGQHTVS